MTIDPIVESFHDEIKHYQSNIEVLVQFPKSKDDLEFYRKRLEETWADLESYMNRPTLGNLIKRIFKR